MHSRILFGDIGLVHYLVCYSDELGLYRHKSSSCTLNRCIYDRSEFRSALCPARSAFIMIYFLHTKYSL